MTPEDRFADDPILARVNAARPALPEADLSPDGDRAAAILARVLAAPGTRDRPASPSARRRRRLRRPSGLGGFGAVAVAAVTAALVFVVIGVAGGGGGGHHHEVRLGSHPVPAADAIHLDSHGTFPPRMRRVLDRTPLGRAIVAQFRNIQEDIGFGTATQNRRALEQLQFNQAACEHAAVVVGAVSATPAQRYIQYDWVHGSRVQAREDALYITALRAFAAGDRTTGERVENQASDLSNVADLFTAYAENQLGGNGGGPLPHVPGFRGPGDSRSPAPR